MKGLTLKGIRIKAEFSFLVFNALVFLLRDQRLIITFYIVCAFHEAGHTAAAHLVGKKIKSMILSGTGIRIETYKNAATPLKNEIFILISGPALNLILFFLCRITGGISRFAILNLAAAVYNLLPYCQLDGGALIDILISGTIYEREMRILFLCLKILISALLFYSVIKISFEFMPLLAASVILLVSDEFYRRK